MHGWVLVFFLYTLFGFPNNLQGAHTDFIIYRITTTEKELTPHIRGIYREATEAERT